MHDPNAVNLPFIEENDQTRARREHLAKIVALIGNPYPNRFERSRIVRPDEEDTITAIVRHFAPFVPSARDGARPAPEEIERANRELNRYEVRVAGRLATPPRVMGKAAFVHLADGVSRLQIYVRKGEVTAVTSDGRETDGWELFELLDQGDFIGVSGYLFVTKTGELSVHAQKLYFLAKALLPMPDKLHGIADPEVRQRQRYLDLIASSIKVERDENELSTREVFERRAQLIREIRRFLDEHGFIEVETPMLSPLATGAAARPFQTWHNALGIPLYARIAPELYLKRLVVGGFERVYELNRNFRNEGLSVRHNPEFTMLEFYCAYWDAHRMMDFCEELLRTVVERVCGTLRVRYDQHEIDFAPPFTRVPLTEAIVRHWPAALNDPQGDPVSTAWLKNDDQLALLVRFCQTWQRLAAESHEPDAALVAAAWQQARAEAEPLTDETARARALEEIFAVVAEERLVQPTFVTDFPKAISPLAKASMADPTLAERFELFIAGMEVANGFSELNDPEEQYRRFLEQAAARERGDEEAMVMDEDFLRALSYGMPPTAGIGIGIDRLTMLLTDRRSIRDVILFPHLRPKKRADQERADEPT
ncbi:MAG: lysine--tRNA ligase [Pyrinomonas sp.]|uniref:lysine--tRNA ligase n=1 Tax=Pyrinomonas sp. TaxID=2080306 RepID=UPI003325610E